MARTFDGTGDRIALTPAARVWTNGACMAAWAYRASDTGSFETIYYGGATGSGNPALYVGTTDLLEAEWNGAAGVASTIVVPVGEWVFLAATKSTGAVTTTFYMFRTSTMAWTVNTPAGTEAQPATTARTVEFIGAHGAGADEWTGDILCVGVWGVFATQAMMDTLVFDGWEAWLWFHPVVNTLHLLDQDSIADSTRDWCGLQNQTSIIGTTVSTNPPPPFWGWNGNSYIDDVAAIASQNITITPITNVSTYHGIIADQEQVITPAAITNVSTYHGLSLGQNQIITLSPITNVSTYLGLTLRFTIVLSPIVNISIYGGLALTFAGGGVNTSRWNGTSWVAMPNMVVWNGSSWVAKNDTRWNGSAWV